MPDDFAGFDTTEIEIEEEMDPAITDVESPKIDYDAMKININGVGKAIMGDETDAYKYWVIKCLLTERYSYLAYSTDFGIEFQDIVEADYSRDIAESELERTIREALMIDVRTVSVGEFDFDWEGDGVHVKFIIESIYNDHTIELIRGGEVIGRVRI